MVSGWQSGDWIGTTEHSRLTDSASPQSERSSNATAIQESDIRPPVGDQPPQVPPNPAFPQRYTSLPTSPLDQNTGHKDTRTRTDPSTRDRFLLFPPATLAEQASLPKLPLGNITDSAGGISSRHPAQLTLHTPGSLDTSSQQNASPAPDHFAQALWDNDPAKPGAVLFSTGPIMPKPTSSQPPDTDPGRRSVDRGFWAAPSGVPSSNVSLSFCHWALYRSDPDGYIFHVSMSEHS
ncbi:hypothetical protein B0J17DRAFT_325125 [Rhizoctonia solani]|nr:hypothetical protein B0J17DRAFT_325125 [Rhizoctonia solani]